MAEAPAPEVADQRRPRLAESTPDEAGAVETGAADAVAQRAARAAACTRAVRTRRCEAYAHEVAAEPAAATAQPVPAQRLTWLRVAAGRFRHPVAGSGRTAAMPKYRVRVDGAEVALGAGRWSRAIFAALFTLAAIRCRRACCRLVARFSRMAPRLPGLKEWRLRAWPRPKPVAGGLCRNLQPNPPPHPKPQPPCMRDRRGRAGCCNRPEPMCRAEVAGAMSACRYHHLYRRKGPCNWAGKRCSRCGALCGSIWTMPKRHWWKSVPTADVDMVHDCTGCSRRESIPCASIRSTPRMAK